MKLIRLHEQVVYGGWEDVPEFKPVLLNIEQIETLRDYGLTHIRTKSGEVLKVKESVDFILGWIQETQA